MINKITHTHTHSYLHEQQLAAQVRRTEISSAGKFSLQLAEPPQVSDRQKGGKIHEHTPSHPSIKNNFLHLWSQSEHQDTNTKATVKNKVCLRLITVWWSPEGLGLREPPGSGWYWLWSDSVGGTAELILQNQNRNASPPHPDRCQATKRQENR